MLCACIVSDILCIVTIDCELTCRASRDRMQSEVRIMKAKLIRCHICHDWFSPLRSHCPNCGASEIAPMTFVSVSNDGLLKPMASGLERLPYALELALRIAK